MTGVWSLSDEAALIWGEVKRELTVLEAHRKDDLPDSWGDWLDAYDDKALALKRINFERIRRGDLAWDGVLLEKTFTALAEPDRARQRAELVRLAAAAVAYIGKLDRRSDGVS